MRNSLPNDDERVGAIEAIVAFDELTRTVSPELLAAARRDVGALLADF
jgi:hypothetical protein